MEIEQMLFKRKQNTIYAINRLVIDNSVTDSETPVENLFKPKTIDRTKISLV